MMIDRVDWQHPPSRFADWKDNPLVYGTVAKPETKQDNVQNDEPVVVEVAGNQSWDELNKLFEE